MTLSEFMTKAEQDFIRKTIAECNGNKKLAAGRLDISLATLYRKQGPVGEGLVSPVKPPEKERV